MAHKRTAESFEHAMCDPDRQKLSKTYISGVLLTIFVSRLY